MATKRELYEKLYNSYLKAYSHSKSKQTCQADVNKTWNDIKNYENLPVKVDELVKSYSTKAMNSQAGLLKFWSNAASQKPNTPRPARLLDDVSDSSQADPLPAFGSSQFVEPISDEDNEPSTSKSTGTHIQLN